MNIIVTGTKVTLDNRTLAFQKNNLVDTMTITVDTDETWQYKLDVKYPRKDGEGDELYNVIDLPREGNTCTAIMRASMLPFNGKYTMQLRGISGDKVYHTDTFDVWVKYSIDPSKVYDPIPSEFYQIEQTVTEQAANAKQSETNAAESAAKAEDAAVHSPLIGENGNWFVWDFEKSEYVDSDKSASTPPITPDTAGKYLTNNGSKAEWGEVKESVEVGDAKDGNLLKLSGNDVLDAATPNVDYALPTLYVTITQDGQDSDGNPIYKSDKTYEEINAAWRSDQEVKIANTGVFDADFLVFLGIQEIPLIYVQSSAYFAARGVLKANSYNAQSYMVGGQPIATVEVLISYTGKVRVILPLNRSTNEWVEVNKLPQQYTIEIVEGANGTLTADWTYDEIQKTIDAYDSDKGGTALFRAKNRDKLYQIYEYIPSGKTIVFMTFLYDSFVKLILSNRTGEDVWTKEYFQPWQLEIPVTTADNGKFMRVVNGQWAADMAGGETWELIRDFTLAEDVVKATINSDENGKPFRLKRAYVFITATAPTDESITYTADICCVTAAPPANPWGPETVFLGASPAFGKPTRFCASLWDTYGGCFLPVEIKSSYGDAIANILVEKTSYDSAGAIRTSGNGLEYLQSPCESFTFGSYRKTLFTGANIKIYGVRA